MPLLQLWFVLRKQAVLLVVSALVGLALAAGLSWTQPRTFSAISTGYVVAGSSATVGDALAGKSLAADKAATYVPLVQSRSVAERVADEVGPDAGPIRLAATTDGVIFRITATSTSGKRAAEIADAAIRATSIEANALETLTVSGESSGKTVVRIVPVEPAVTPTTPVSPNWARNLVLGFGLGVVVGGGLIMVRHSLDRRVRQVTDAEIAADASGLGIIPFDRQLEDPELRARDMGPAAEALRQLRTNLLFLNVDHPVRSIVITSSNEGEGKSTVAAHLAAMLAESGQPTVLVDADLRRPTQGRRFDLDGLVGLTQHLAGVVPLSDVLAKTGHTDLTLLPAGRIPPNPSELLGSQRMRQMIAKLSEDYVVLIDAPPLLPVTDATLLAVAADGAIVVVRSGKTRIEELQLATRKIRQVEGRIFGTVLNMVPRKELGAAALGYGYGYGYGDYSSTYLSEPEAPPIVGRRRGKRSRSRS